MLFDFREQIDELHVRRQEQTAGCRRAQMVFGMEQIELDQRPKVPTRVLAVSGAVSRLTLTDDRARSDCQTRRECILLL